MKIIKLHPEGIEFSREAIERILKEVMAPPLQVEWPLLEIIHDREQMLALQLVCWGNIMMGSEPPDEFVDWLDEASRITGAWTNTECLELANKITYERRKYGNTYGSRRQTNG